MRINLTRQVIDGAGKDRKVYKPGLGVGVPEHLGNALIKRGLATAYVAPTVAADPDDSDKTPAK